MKLNYLLLITMFNLFSCKYNFPKPSDNWFATQIFVYDGIAIDQDINQVYMIDEKTGFLLGEDVLKVIGRGGSEKDQSAYFFRSTDGGKSFEKQVFPNKKPEFISRSADGKTFYMVLSQFAMADTLKPSAYQILKSADMGKTWQNLYLFENINVEEVPFYSVTKVLFYNDFIGFVSILAGTYGDEKELLYRTDDGGKTWKPAPVDMDNLSLNLITPGGKIMGQYDKDEPAVWEMDIKDMIVKKIPLNFSDSLRMIGFIETDLVTNRHYVLLWKKTSEEYDDKMEIEPYLLWIETGEKIKLPDNSYDVNVYGDYIGVNGGLKANKFISQYYYSEDKGKTWKAETPKCIVCSAPSDMYGKGYVWLTTPMTINGIYAPLMVRIPQDE